MRKSGEVRSAMRIHETVLKRGRIRKLTCRAELGNDPLDDEVEAAGGDAAEWGMRLSIRLERSHVDCCEASTRTAVAFRLLS